MNARALSASVAGLALFVAGCAFAPRVNHRLEEVRASYAAARADEPLARLAPAELERALATFQLADAAWNTLDDAAVVDHLAYVAKQRLAIARATALRATADEAAATARREHERLGAARLIRADLR